MKHRQMACLQVFLNSEQREEVVQTAPPEVKRSRYVYCDFSAVVHLKYKTLAEAISDVKWDYVTNKEVRVIDEMASEHFGNAAYGMLY